METADDLLRLFESRMAELGMSQAQLEAKAFGKAGNTSIQNLKKGASPSYERVAAMARALQLELYLGLPRPDGMAEPEGASDFRQRNIARVGYLTIPWAKAELGKGSAPVAVLGSWLTANELSLDRLSAVEPDISLVDWLNPKGAVAIIEARAPRRGAGQLWCLEEKAKVTIARVAFLADGRFVIMPRTLDQAPSVHQLGGEFGPLLLGRVACLAMVTGS